MSSDPNSNFPSNNLIVFPLDNNSSQSPPSKAHSSKTPKSHANNNGRLNKVSVSNSGSNSTRKPGPTPPPPTTTPITPTKPKSKLYRFFKRVAFVAVIYYGYNYYNDNIKNVFISNEPPDSVVTIKLNQYLVATKNVDLNVRATPSTSSEIVMTLEKNSTVYGKPTISEDWVEITNSIGTTIGFASARYLVLIENRDTEELSAAERLELEYLVKREQATLENNIPVTNNPRYSEELNEDLEYYEDVQTDEQTVYPIPESDIIPVVEQDPELIGGMEALQRSIRYPETAREAGIEGRVFVQFVVDENGNVLDPVVTRGIGGGCDETALEAVRNAKFKPGKQQGLAVKVQYSLAITFRLQN